MKKISIFLLLAAFFMPLAMNAQTRALKKSIDGFTKLEMKAPANGMSSDLLLSKIEPAREAALEELNGRGMRAVGDYELVTGEQVDWSGDYVITAVSGTTAYVMTGKSSGGNYGAYTTATVSNNTLSYSAVNNYKVTITEYSLNDTYYCTIKQGNYYLALTNAGNYLYFVTTDPATQTGNNRLRGLWTISYEDDDYVKITNAYTTSRYIRFNTRNNQQRFACYQSNSTSVLDVSLFKYNDGSCVPPTDFEATDVDLESATLSWTENGQSQYWVIYYMGENDATTSYEIATSNPFTLSGLTPATTYYALVTPFCGGLDQDSEIIEFTTEDYPCPAPTDLYADNVTINSATLHWTSDAASYNVQYRVKGEEIFSDDFEDAWLNNWQWTTYAQGGTFSGYGWFAYSPDDLLSNSPGAHSGDVCAVSLSYTNSGAITANNYLVTPQFALGGSVSFWVMSNYNDQYEVLLSTGGNAVNNFTITLQSLAAAPASWTLVNIDLSAYAGQQGYVAIHHSQYDGWVLFVDDFSIDGPAGPWLPANSADLTGLDPDTEYEWQVQGDCGSDGLSLWSDIANFTTLNACAAPTGLTADNITNTSAALSWTGYTDTYDVQYREYNPTEPVTIILNVPTDIWNDGTGYQLVLDADHNTYGSTIPETGNFTAGTFADFEYTIPENAECNASTTTIVVNGSASITIPAGVYDYVFLNPDPSSGTYYIASDNGFESRGDDFEFVAGKTYEFTLSIVSGHDYITLTTTADWTTVSGVTNPYPLTGLNMDTDYEVQVQGEGCDNWSESAFFTTLNGILVTNITADDVTVLVGETASITNLVVEPSDATNPAVTYTSNGETVATVDASGVVTGVGVGTTTITIAATDGSGVTFDITVTVTGIDVTNIAASDVTVVNGQTATISYTVTPNNATDASVTFTSADPTIATVDADGVVTGTGVGETTITIASVSNPDVTATVTVTVTSNPDAVQFTVNVPATAHPGDVITVEAYMAAPTSGNYDGFTSLGVHLYYDNTAFQHTADPSYGAVGNACMMHTFTYPEDGVVRVSFIQPAGSPTTVTGLLFSMEFTVLEGIESGSYTFHVEPMAAANFTCNYNNGQPATQIPYEYTPSTVEVTVLSSFFKDIIGYAGPNGNGGNYYLIATPIGTVAPADVKDANDATRSMVDSNDDYDFDLYYFDNDQDFEWINYKGDANFSNPGGFNLEPGKGYLYANSQNIRLEFTGYAYTELDEVTLTISSTNPYSMKNWNLVGNPFAQTAWLVEGYDFYTMNNDATMIVQVGDGFENSIEAMEGIFVKAANDGDVLHFTTTEPAKSNGKGLILNLNQGQKLIDRAVVRFGEGRTLPKFQIKKNCTQLYIPMDNEDYAVVRSEEVGEMPVSFKAEENGSYTLNFSALNTEFGYLHLIDNMNGNDVDLLATPSYSFVAKTTDYANRFKLVFATGNALEDSFAFFSNGSFVINNEGNATLQVIDINGRILSNETINGCANVNVNAASGVYMLRLINGDNVKVQKVVVR